MYTSVVLYWEHETNKFLSYLILHVFFSIEFVVASFKSCKETDALTFYNTIVKSLFDIRELVDKTHTKPAAKLWYVAEDLVHRVRIKVSLIYNLQYRGQEYMYYEVLMLKSMLVNKDFQTWLLIGWQHICQPIRSQVKKSLLNNMDFNMDFSK